MILLKGPKGIAYICSGQKHNVAFTAAPLAYNELRALTSSRTIKVLKQHIYWPTILPKMKW